MTVDFYETRAPAGAPVATLDDADLEVINQALHQSGVPWSIDPYGTTKMTNANMRQIAHALQDAPSPVIARKVEKLARYDCLYGLGE